MAKVLSAVPNFLYVKNNGFGWKSDKGADLIIDRRTVVQVKSYTGVHSDTYAVKQLEEAINYFEAEKGILITTGETTRELEVAMHRLELKMRNRNVEVELIAGNDVVKFVLKYAWNLLI